MQIDGGDTWFEQMRKRLEKRDDPDAVAMLGFVEMLLLQMVMDEKRRKVLTEIVGPKYALTFECHACGERRPDHYISVAHRKVTGLAPAGAVVQINARYCNDRPDCLRAVPDWLDRVAKPIDRASSRRPANIDRPALRVHHLYLQPFEALMLEPSDRYKVLCPLCGGMLLVYRNQETMALSRRDRCIRCGQLYVYLDDKIGGEPLEPLDPGCESLDPTCTPG